MENQKPEPQYKYHGEAQRESEALRVERLDQLDEEFQDAQRMLQNSLFKLATYEVHPSTNRREAWSHTVKVSDNIHAAMRSIELGKQELTQEKERVLANKMPQDMKTQFEAAQRADLRSLEAQTGTQERQPAETLKRPVSQAHLNKVAQIANERSQLGQSQNNQQDQGRKR